MIDVRYPTALQLMLSLALAQREGVSRLSSLELAKGVGSNASFVRKLLAPLIEAGLVSSTLGRDGGLSLGRDPRSITLFQIYRATTGDRPLWPPRGDIPHRCVVSRNVERFFVGITEQVETAIAEQLSGRTLESALDELQRADASPKRTRRENTPRASSRRS